MFFIPCLFFLSLLGSYYTFLRFKKYTIDYSFVVAYVLTLVSITFSAKLILFLQLILFSKFILIFFLAISILILLNLRFIILKDLKILINLINKNNFNIFFSLIFIYLLIQSILLPPSNFDGLAYHIQRNYIFLNEGTLYPLNNAHYANQVFLPLNSDLLFFFHAIFKSNFFMNIFSFFSYIVILILIKSFLILIKLEKKKIFSIFFIFLSFSSITLSLLSTKNDIIIATFGISIVFFIHSFIKDNLKLSLIMFFISVFYAIGIKWNLIFYLITLSPFILFYIIKSKKFFVSTKYFVILLPILLIISPLEIGYYNLINETGHIVGPVEFILGHTNPDGVNGLISNLFRIIISLIDITIPLHYFNINFISNSLNFITFNTLESFLGSSKLGVADSIKWLEFDYAYTLKPHSDYTGYSISGFIVSIYSFYYLAFGKNRYLKSFAFISILNVLILCYTLTWQPWFLRFLMLSMIINLMVFTEFIKNIKNRKLEYINILCLTIFLFNIIFNVSQPLFKHSNTPSWLNAFIDREAYQSYSIPDLNKINNAIRLIPDNKRIIIILEKGGSQTPYEILRKTNSYYVFSNINLNNFFQQSYFDKKLKIEYQDFDFIINTTNQGMSFNNFLKVSNSDNNNFELFSK